MPDFVTLSCPSCGGKLQITPDIDRFACGHCGLEHMVRRGSGIVSISPIVEALKNMGEGVDRTASELALVRLEKELQDLYLQRHRVGEEKARHSGNGCGLIMLIIGVLGALGFIILAPNFFNSPILSDEVASSSLIVSIIVCVLFALVGYFWYSAEQKQVAKFGSIYNPKIKTIEQLIQQKQDEIAAHKNIVQQNKPGVL